LRTGRVLAGGLFGAVLALGVVTAPATAADGWQRTADVSDGSYNNGYAKTCATTGYGQACFQGYGEWIWLRDLYTNGEPVAMQWYHEDADGHRSGHAYWDGGSGAGWTNLNKSFGEYGDFNFRVCEVDLSDDVVIEDTCSPWKWAST
jgi:hypothetical protein